MFKLIADESAPNFLTKQMADGILLAGKSLRLLKIPLQLRGEKSLPLHWPLHNHSRQRYAFCHYY
jgi:hypothetical protein